VAQVVLAPGVVDDFDRILEHLLAHESEAAPGRVRAILAAIDVLASSPLIGRPVRRGKRELVIGRGTSGYVALYKFAPASDKVTVLALRGQKEAGYGGAGARGPSRP
jgi:plasmid stabilization system protein ParE